MNKLSFISSIPGSNDTYIYVLPTNSQKSLNLDEVSIKVHILDLRGNSLLVFPVASATSDGVCFTLSNMSNLGSGTYAIYLELLYADHQEFYPNDSVKYLTIKNDDKGNLVFTNMFTAESSSIVPPQDTKSNLTDVLHVHDIDLKSIETRTVPDGHNANVTLDQNDNLIFEIPKGTTGDRGPTGQVGPKGPQGLKGDKGDTGKSTYQVWLDAGNKGTETDFINSLKGAKGDKGDQGPIGPRGETGLPGKDGSVGPQGPKGDIGPSGKDGSNGLSAYQVWLNNGHSGTEDDFFNYLKGAKGIQGPIGKTGPRGIQGPKGDQGRSVYLTKLTLGGNLVSVSYPDLLVDSNVVPNVGDYLLQPNGSLVEVISVNHDSETLGFSKVLASLQGPAGKAGKEGKSAYDIAVSNGFNGTESQWLQSLKATNVRHAPTGYTLDRTTNPWTIWFDNGSAIQFPGYSTTATVYGYNQTVNVYSTSWVVFPLISSILSASHGTLTLDTVTRVNGGADYWDVVKVLNPINGDADSYDWSNVYFNDVSRAGNKDYSNYRQKNFLKACYELGIYTFDDLKPFGLVEK